MKYVVTLCPKCGRPLFKGEIMCFDCLCVKPKHKIIRNKSLSKIKVKKLRIK